MVGWMSSLGAALPPLSESIMKIHMNAPVHGKLEHFSCECVWNIGVYIYILPSPGISEFGMGHAIEYQ